MAVQARFYVQSIQRFAYNPETAVVQLSPSTRGEENKAWAAATPSGGINMTIQNGAASDFFEKAMESHADIAVSFDLAPSVEQ